MSNFFLVLDFVFFWGGGGRGWPGVADLKYSSAIFFNCPLSNPCIMSIVDSEYHDGLHISTQNYT